MKPAPAIPSIPCRSSHSARTSFGTGMLVIQLTVVPPPTVAPARIAMCASLVAVNPESR